MDINEKEILKNTIGKNELGETNSSICMELYLMESLDDESRSISSSAVCGPIVEIESRNEFVQIDLIFDNSKNIELRKMWFSLENFGKEIAKDRESTDLAVPYLNLTILPLKYDGKYFWLCLNPIMWTLQPEVPGGEPNVLRILFYSHEINLMSTNVIQSEEVDKELERELANLQYQEEQYALKEEEEEAYQEERNRKLEELRRKR